MYKVSYPPSGISHSIHHDPKQLSELLLQYSTKKDSLDTTELRCFSRVQIQLSTLADVPASNAPAQNPITQHQDSECSDILEWKVIDIVRNGAPVVV